jgi:hypothetical protein
VPRLQTPHNRVCLSLNSNCVVRRAAQFQRQSNVSDPPLLTGSRRYCAKFSALADSSVG